MRRFIFLLVLSVATVFAAGCNSNTNGKSLDGTLLAGDTMRIAEYRDSLNWFFDYLLLSNSPFSGGILVAKDGNILYEKYTGFVDTYKRDTITAETPFHVASTSKTFTSIAILQLVEQGKLNFEDSLTKYFSGFPYPQLKVRHLLTHSSGIGNYAYLFPRYKWNTRNPVNNDDVLRMLYSYKPRLEFTPGTRFKYSNTNFVLLATLVERISGESFPEFVRKNIFEKAGMKNSYVYSEKSDRKQFTESYYANGRPYGFNYLDNLYGDKNVFTTCRDLFKYDSIMYAGGLVSKRMLEAAQQPYFMDHRNKDTLEYYGLGFRLKIFNDSTKIAYHNGWWHGNNAVFQRLLNEGVTIIVTGSRFNRKIYDATLAANIFAPYYLDKYFMEVEKDETGGEDTQPATD